LAAVGEYTSIDIGPDGVVIVSGIIGIAVLHRPPPGP
jgi:hypothetical protein